MTIKIISVGKSHDAALANYIADFEKRLQPQHKLEWLLIPPSGNASPGACRDVESAAVLGKLKTTDTLVLLDERGSRPDNQEFAAKFEDWLGRQGQLVIVIGGAFGVNEELRSRAQYVWSFSPLVFPHQLVRAIVVEQLYRTTAILNNHPYHHV